jgi:hypothetical protein
MRRISTGHSGAESASPPIGRAGRDGGRDGMGPHLLIEI